MSSAIWNIVFGLLAVGGALSGRFQLPFTKGPVPLLIVGIAITALGIYQAVKARRLR